MNEGRAFKTELFSIAELMDAVRGGRVRVPLFQRGFVWSDDDRLQLFDSIQKGYPIGTLLLAKGEADAGTLRLGDYTRVVDEHREAMWVVDGQQRLSTLAMSLLGDFTGAHRPVYFDLEHDEFVLGVRRRAPRAAWVPTSVLGSSKTLNRWLREASFGDDLNDRADTVAATLREYAIPAYVVPYRGNDEVPQEIFARINRRGRALTRQEVFDALHARGAMGKPLEYVATSLTRLGFGALSPSVIERSTVALLGRSPGAIPEKLGDADEVRAIFDRVERSLARAIEFLSAEAGVPHQDWLPYDGALPTLARLFALHPELHPRNTELLVRWFWRGSISGLHQTNNAVNGPQWAAIRDDEHGSVQRLLRPLPSFTQERLSWHLEAYRRGTADTDIELIAMYALTPRVLVGEERGATVQPATMLARQSDDLAQKFPCVIAPGGASDRTVAHVLLHPRITLDELRAVPYDAVLHESHGINREAWEALVAGDDAGFFARRAARLRAHIECFLVERMGLRVGDRDHPPLDAYLTEESA